MRFQGEIEDLEQIRKLAEGLGFGNAIQYLKFAWADYLLEKYPSMSRELCAMSAGMNDKDRTSYVKGFTVIHNPSTRNLMETVSTKEVAKASRQSWAKFINSAPEKE